MTNPSRRPRRRRSAGFTLAEILVGASLSLMMLGAIYTFQQGQTRALAAQNAYNDSQNVTRTVIDLMTRELRMATYDPTSPGALTTSPGPTCPGVEQGIVEATPSTIRFEQDLNGDGAIGAVGESVEYDVLGEELRRADGANTPVTLVSGVPAGGFVLRYFDGSNPPVELVPSGSPAALTASQRNCVSKIRITVHANVPNPDPNNPMPLASAAESEVAIRNRSLANF
jgi:Tfp pilus assembly protein PilW